MHSRTERNKLTTIRGRERNPSGSPTVPNLSRPGNELNTHPFLARPAPAREQFCPCRAAVARARGGGVTGHGGVCGDVVFCFHPERPAFAAGARGRRLLGALWPVSGSSRRPRGAARCLRSGGEDGAGQPGTRRAPPRVTGARPRASAEPPLCGAVSRGHGRGRHSGRGGRDPGRVVRGGARAPPPASVLLVSPARFILPRPEACGVPAPGTEACDRRDTAEWTRFAIFRKEKKKKPKRFGFGKFRKVAFLSVCARECKYLQNPEEGVVFLELEAETIVSCLMMWVLRT